VNRQDAKAAKKREQGQSRAWRFLASWRLVNWNAFTAWHVEWLDRTSQRPFQSCRIVTTVSCPDGTALESDPGDVGDGLGEGCGG